jgi:hypothetical protein
MANVKDFAERQTNGQTGQKLYVPDLSIRGMKKKLYHIPSSGHCTFVPKLLLNSIIYKM